VFRWGSRKHTRAPSLPMRRRFVQRIAKLAEVDLKHIKVRIVKGTKGTGFKGYTRDRRCIELYEDAFESAEELANTLGHECSHVEDLKAAGTDRFSNSLQVIESEEKARVAGQEAQGRYVWNSQNHS
jgi:hypothetical protein